MAAIASLNYTPAELTEIDQWTTASAATQPGPSPTFLDSLESHLATRTTILGTKPSSADIAVYSVVAPLVKSWSPEERTGETGRPSIVRLVDFVQNATSVFGVDVAPENKVEIDPDHVLFVKPVVDPKTEKERLKKEKAAAAAAEGKTETLVERTKNTVAETVEQVKELATAAAAGAKKEKAPKEKKEKAPKPQKAAAAAPPLSPSLIDLRVGHVLKAIKHPEADSLYISTIALGDAPGTEDTFEHEGQICRTVCSGLNGLVPLEDMQGRRVVVVSNLKPVKMRGIKSCGLVLAASPRVAAGEDDHKGPVELIAPPEGAPAGERVFFEGWKGEPEGVLNPKKKVWELIQPGFLTTEGLEVAFDAGAVKELGKDGVGRLVTEAGAVCTVPSLKGAVIR